MEFGSGVNDVLKENSDSVNSLSAESLNSCIQQAHDTILSSSKTSDSLACVLTAVFVESARLDADLVSLEAFLKSCDLEQPVVDTLVHHFKKCKNEYRDVLSRIGWNPPFIVDCNWKLSQKITSSVAEDDRRPVYTIDLSTVQTGCPHVSHLQLQCTPEQLQALVWKLKEASKAVEKISKPVNK